ncbi:polysaccharide biosynthesis/export family protein [uncultured Novosphingobium sp.]|uniref:polysaccharide biosynthesis/export family protein n=1 Tax=uncultured Novosphingobium sp. TaxID=292277 RepID=UPI0025866E52|nr:polysaccharide biosynthesis/export family protein [uncultured Novosphingobium sp.]
MIRFGWIVSAEYVQNKGFDIMRAKNTLYRYLGVWAVACLPLPIGGCASTDRQAAPTVAEVREYRLGAGDALRLIFYGEDKLNGEYSIASDGRLALPLIGTIDAGGKTLPQLQEAVRTAYAKGGYLLDPKVAVEILHYRPFFVLGEVNAPGQYPFIPGMTVRQAIATAKGYTYRAQQGSAMITRWGDASEVSYKLSPGTAVNPGDTIRVPERHF